MREIKRRYWIVPLVVFLICLGFAVQAFMEDDRGLSRDLEKLESLFGRHPGLALDDAMR